MVYVDRLYYWEAEGWTGGRWCHMWADTPEELHTMADKLGLKRSWYHGGHYNLRARKRTFALGLGAVPGTRQDLKVFLKQRAERRNSAAVNT